MSEENEKTEGSSPEKQVSDIQAKGETKRSKAAAEKAFESGAGRDVVDSLDPSCAPKEDGPVAGSIVSTDLYGGLTLKKDGIYFDGKVVTNPTKVYNILMAYAEENHS